MLVNILECRQKQNGVYSTFLSFRKVLTVPIETKRHLPFEHLNPRTNAGVLKLISPVFSCKPNQSQTPFVPQQFASAIQPAIANHRVLRSIRRRCSVQLHQQVHKPLQQHYNEGLNEFVFIPGQPFGERNIFTTSRSF